MKISYEQRIKDLAPNKLAKYKEIYKIPCKKSMIDFINRFCFIYNPNNLKNPIMPFELFKQQENYIKWLFDRFMNREKGIVEKPRDVGVTWVSLAVLGWFFLFQENISAGVFTYKASQCDKRGNLSTIIEKARFIIKHLPKIFKPNNYIDNLMYLKNEDNNNDICGLAGDFPDTGGRKTIIIKDESAFYEKPEKIEMSLSEVSDCIIDISTHNGTNTLFFKKCMASIISKFKFDWFDNPYHTKELYNKKKEEAEANGVIYIFKMNIECDPAGSIDSVVIPSSWVNNSKKHDFKIEGKRVGALDVADEGKDTNCLTMKDGNILKDIHEWGGVGSDISETTDIAFWKAVDFKANEFRYDRIGVGAGVKGEIRKIKEKIEKELELLNEQLKTEQNEKIKGNLLKKKERFEIAVNMRIVGWDARGSVLYPDEIEFGENTNKELFQNAKVQAVFKLRNMFRNTNRLVEGKEYNEEKIIYLKDIQDHHLFNKMVNEISQYRQRLTDTGKLSIIKVSKGQKSPNIADSIVMLFADTEEVYIKMERF